MADDSDYARSDGDTSNVMSNHPHDLGQPAGSLTRRSHDGYELQPLSNEGLEFRYIPSDSRVPPPYPPSHTLSPGSQRTLLPGQSYEDFRSSYRDSSAGYQSTIRQDDGSRESLLGGHEGLVPRRQSTVMPHRSKIVSDAPTDHAVPMSIPLKSQPMNKKYSSHRYWAWEISASILSIACMASIVGVLVHEQNKPLRQWGFGQISFSPNVVVSLLGTLGKSACLVAVAEIVSQLKWIHYQNNPQKLSDLQLFDDASRGPWGALQLAIRKNMKTLLATCASIITVASLLIDPFIQSVFSFPSILTPVQGQFPTILSSQSYGLLGNASMDDCIYNQRPRTTLEAAILRPIYNATKEPYLPCSFERCEWPTISTLGVCSDCIDLTDTIASTCAYTVTKWNYKVPMYQRQIQCNYTLPEIRGQSGGATPVQAVFSSDMVLDGDQPTLANTSTIWNSSTEQPKDGYWHQPIYSALINNFTFIRFDPVVDFERYIPGGWDTLHNVTGFTGPPAKEAGQCTMRICAKTFETPYYGNFTASSLAGPYGRLVENGSEWMSGPVVVLKLEPESEIPIPKNTTFKFRSCDWTTLPDFLYTLFSVSIDNYGTTEMGGDKLDILTGFIPNIGGPLSNVVDIAGFMGQIADSLTEEIRTSADSNSTNGVGMNSEVFIIIDWAWLALPISVTVLTFVLLLVVIITNHARGVPAWRSSSLALLFYEVDGWDTSQMIVRGPEDMDARAKEMKAQVTYEQDLLLFSKAE